MKRTGFLTTAVLLVMILAASCEFDRSMIHVVEVEVTSASGTVQTANIDVRVGRSQTGTDNVELPYREEVARVRQYVGHQFPVEATAALSSGAGDITVTVYINGGVFDTAASSGPNAWATVTGDVINITY